MYTGKVITTFKQTYGTDGQKDMGVDYNGLVAHLVKAIKELSAKVEELEAKLG